MNYFHSPIILFIMVISMLKSILVIVGTIIGAGFASGKEIYCFFNCYQWYGFFGLFVAVAIIGFVIARGF